MTGTSLAFLAFAMVSPVAFAATGTQFAAYQVTGTFHNQSISAVVNESVSGSSVTGMSNMTLRLGSVMGNFSYSKIVNATKVMFPYFPGTANQSLSFQYHNYSISVSIAQIGTRSISYGVASYSLTEYSFSISTLKTAGSPMSARGNISVFPSGLVYSASILANGTEPIQVQLLGTNLDLNAPSNSSAQTTSIAVAGGAGSILAGVGAFVFYRRKNNAPKQEKTDKPLYHVD